MAVVSPRASGAPSARRPRRHRVRADQLLAAVSLIGGCGGDAPDVDPNPPVMQRPDCIHPRVQFPADDGTRADRTFVPGDPLIIIHVSEGRMSVGGGDVFAFPATRPWYNPAIPGFRSSTGGPEYFIPPVEEPCQEMRIEIQSTDCASFHAPPRQLTRQVSCASRQPQVGEVAAATVMMSGKRLAGQAYVQDEAPAGEDPPDRYTLHAEATFGPGPSTAPTLSVSFDPTHAITWPADEVQTSPTGWLHGPPRAGDLQIDGLPFRVVHLEAHAFVDADLRLPRFAFWGRGSVDDHWAIRTAADPTLGEEPRVPIQPCELDGGCFDFVWHSDVLADFNVHTDFRLGFAPGVP